VPKPEDKALLEITAQLGRIRVTQDNQAQIHGLVDDGLMQRDGDSHYCLTEAGQQSI
jgi:predicted transcriptional regulator